MKRRKFLATLGSGTLLGATAAQPLHAASENLRSRSWEWRMVTTWPKNFPVLGTGAEELARQMQSYGGLEMLEHGLD